MHARIATARTRPDSALEVEQVWRDLLESYEATGVFRGMVSMYDATAGVAVTLTFWESDAAADQAAEALRPRAVAAFEGLLLEPPEIKPYDVLFTHMPAVAE